MVMIAASAPQQARPSLPPAGPRPAPLAAPAPPIPLRARTGQDAGEVVPPIKHRREMSAATLVLGEENARAHAAANAVIRSPGLYSPLGLVGGPGLGKTHLSRVITAGIKRNAATRHPEHVYYVTGEGFATRYHEHVRHGLMLRLRTVYLEAAALIIDGADSVGDPHAQEELANLIATLRAGGVQVVWTARATVGSMEWRARVRPALSTALREGATVVPLVEPRLPVAARIIRQAAGAEGLTLTLEQATRLVSGARERCAGDGRPLLPLALSLVTATARRAGVSCGDAIDIALESALGQADAAQRSAAGGSGVRVESSVLEVCRYYGISKATLLSKRRDLWMAQARQLAMYLLHEDGGLGVTRVGRELGRDHSTVLHGVARIREALARDDQEVVDALRDIRKALSGTQPQGQD